MIDCCAVLAAQERGEMITYITGNIFHDTADALVNPINCVGICGKGLAREFKQRFPENFEEYIDRYKRGVLHPGRIYIHLESAWIMNFTTKDHWRDPSKLEWIESGLEELKGWVFACNVKSIAIPALGCGEGKLKWIQFKSLIEWFAASMPNIDVRVYPPQ